MGALVGLGLGLGLLLIWSAFFVPRTPRAPRPGGGRGRQLLARAGLGDVSVASLTALCVVFAPDCQVTGRFHESLDRLKARLADPVGDRVVEGLRIAREVGGGELGRLLRNLSGYLRDEARTRSEMESRQAWTVSGVHYLPPC